MKTLIKVITALALLSLLPHPGYAQTKPIPNTGVLVSPVPKPSLWSVTYTYPEEANPSGGSVNGRLRSLAITKVGANTHVQITRTEGLVQDMWKVGGEEYGKNSQTPDWIRITPEGPHESESPFFQTNTFPGTEWIKADYYLGTIKYQDIDCLIFMKEPPDGLDINSPDALKQAMQTAPFSAIINATNHLPIEVHADSVKEIFAFGNPPARLTLPEDLVTQLAEGRRAQAAMSIRAPRPY